MIEIDLFIADIKAFLARHDMPKTALGKFVLNDPSFVKRLFEREYDPKIRTVKKVREWMEKQDRRKGYGL